jgi:hypothetical protein
MSTPSPSPQNSCDWSPCKQGEISGLVASLKTHRARTTRRRWMAGATTGALLIAGGWLATRNWPGTAETLVEASCREVRMQAEQYLAGSLSPDMMARIERHLSHCVHCEDALRNARPKQPSADAEPPIETLGRRGRSVPLTEGAFVASR